MLLQPSPAPAPSLSDRLRADGGARALGIGLALLIEGLLLILLLSMGLAEEPAREERSITVVNVAPDRAEEVSPEPASPKRAEQAEQAEDESPPESEQAQVPRPLPPVARPPALPTPLPPVVAAPQAQPAPSVSRPAPAPKRVYGPPDSRGSASRDTERVGTAPNGEPLYAAAWYREPTSDELRGYLSTASGPGWGLIACRTAPNYRVEDCVGLSEYPEGSKITRAVLAAAWQFKVRPPRRGGTPQVGSWVRIRIDYGIRRQ